MRTVYDPANRKDLPTFKCQHDMSVSAAVLYKAWTEGFGTWFAIPESVVMQPRVDTAFFFETEFEGQRHPHYGRFLQLEKDRLISLTWLNAALCGAETIVTVGLAPKGPDALLRLEHAGFPNEKLRDETGAAWPAVLAQQNRALSGADSS